MCPMKADRNSIEVLANFNQSDAGHEQGDLDGDHDVDLTDLALLLAAFGLICP